MHIELVSNQDRTKFGTILSESLDDAVMFKMASAYLSWEGLENLKNPIERILNQGGKVNVLHEADVSVTKPKAIEWLSEVDYRHEQMKYRVVVPGIGATFHPKMYIVRNLREQYTALIGSSNTTSGGLYRNDEINIVVKGNRANSVIAESLSAYDSFITRQGLVKPNAEFLIAYRSIYKSLRKIKIKDLDAKLGELYEELRKFESQSEEYRWAMQTQLDYVVMAMQDIERENSRREIGPRTGIQLNQIIDRSMELAKESGANYVWKTWHNSIRKVLNRNTLGQDAGRKFFIRVGGEDSHSGVYRLSKNGREYVGVKNTN